MILVAADEARRRVKAAMAYAGLEHKDVVKNAGVSDSTLKRIVSKTNPRGASIEQLWAIADACGVPRDFMEYGFPDDEMSIEARLGVVERGLDQLRELFVEITPEQPAGAVAPQYLAVLEQWLKDQRAA